MSWSPFHGPDPFTGTQYTPLTSYSAAYTQNTSNGTWRLSTNGTSAGCTVASGSARCSLVSAPPANMAAEFTMTGTSLQREQGIAVRFTDGDPGNFWGGTGIVVYVENDNKIYVQRLNGGGSHTLLDTVPYTPTSGDALRVETIADAITVRISLTSILTVHDSTYASGTVSLWSGLSLDDGSNMSIDNFTVYELIADGQPTMRRWGGVPYVGGQGIGQKGGGGGRAWGRRRSGIFVPSRFQEAA